ncbi:type IV toxin-antitoxin system AbiEi family antitoxin [Galbitalea sp. SE-J8]|uniref:type IV toxin-antitoxin system AbiEi family antitoxin n=1 Tax=Galbitalea sp. SE-J8 TaxID=3054952 RepID=UPI00259D0967|nr:type IV toxin-antitoxin system AbiEi family antitoxin [Galbitalea sp. SE-J8]MDM4763243.1 type IV toxin-antitoxin system AbiEi family antitoxin [Galbitalea sp. SE-J8]
MTAWPVLTTADLPLAELGASVLDGELFRFDAVFAPIDEFDRPAVRAASIVRVASPRHIAERHSAAWVLGALDDPPRRHELCASVAARTSSAMPGVRVREVVIDEDDLVRVAGLGVTTPVRTVVDLARTAAGFEAADRATCRRLLALGDADAEACRELIERRRNLPNKRQTWDRIRSL